MTEDELKSISDKKLIKKVIDVIHSLASSGGRSHKMSVPVDGDDTDILLSEIVNRFEEKVKLFPSKEEKEINLLLNVIESMENAKKKHKEIMESSEDASDIHHQMRNFKHTEVCVAYKTIHHGIGMRDSALSKAISLDDDDIAYFKNKYKDR